MQKLIGTSLSFCVAQILRGEVAIEQVEKIISGTAYETEAEWAQGFEDYMTAYWNKFPREQVRAVLSKLTIEQPRLKNHRHYPFLIRTPKWVKSESEIVWRDEVEG